MHVSLVSELVLINTLSKRTLLSHTLTLLLSSIVQPGSVRSLSTNAGMVVINDFLEGYPQPLGCHAGHQPLTILPENGIHKDRHHS